MFTVIKILTSGQHPTERLITLYDLCASIKKED